MTAMFQSWGLTYEWSWFFATVAGVLLIAFPLMLAVAMIIYADRKIWAAMALRRTDVGVLAPGNRADLTVIDAPSHLHLAYRPGVPLARALDLEAS